MRLLYPQSTINLKFKFTTASFIFEIKLINHTILIIKCIWCIENARRDVMKQKPMSESKNKTLNARKPQKLLSRPPKNEKVELGFAYKIGKLCQLFIMIFWCINDHC